MVLDMNYWIKVLKRVAVLAISVVLVFLSFKLAIFYMPFLVAFIISLIIEPVIRGIMKHTKLSRKASSIIVFITGSASHTFLPETCRGASLIPGFLPVPGFHPAPKAGSRPRRPS